VNDLGPLGPNFENCHQNFLALACHHSQVDILPQLPLQSNHLVRDPGRSQAHGMYLGVGVMVDGLNMSLCGQGFGVPSGVGVAAEGLNMSLCGQGFGVPCGVGVAA